MHAGLPGLEAVFVALLAVLLVHEHPRGDEVATGGARQRREEVLLAGVRPHLIPAPGILCLQNQHDSGKGGGDCGPAQAHPPADPLAGKAMQDEQPRRHQRSDHVRPVRDRAHRRALDHDDALDPGQDDTAGQQRQCDSEQSEADIDGSPIRSGVGVAHVDQAEDHDRYDDQQAQCQMDQEHDQIEPVLIGLSTGPFQRGHPYEIGRVDRQ